MRSRAGASIGKKRPIESRKKLGPEWRWLKADTTTTTRHDDLMAVI
jgi:hypothetical protein